MIEQNIVPDRQPVVSRWLALIRMVGHADAVGPPADPGATGGLAKPIRLPAVDQPALDTKKDELPDSSFLDEFSPVISMHCTTDR